MTKGSRKYVAGYLLTLLTGAYVLGGFVTGEAWLGFLIFLWGGILEITRREKNAVGTQEH